MGNHNSLEVYTSLTVQLYHDIANCYPNSRETERDLKTLRSRITSEGISFLTKTLPKLGKAIDMAMSSDTALQVSGFCLKPDTSIPRFLGWLIERVFSRDGYIRSDPDITAVRQLRQFLYFSYKLSLPYDPETESSVIESFIQTQEELENIEFPSSVDPVIRIARDIISRVFSGLDVRDIVPKHGPGAVATGERAGEKSNFSRLYSHTERVYPFTEYFTLGVSQVSDQLDWIQSLEELDHGTAKVTLVPKDSRGPRLISMEPLELQWIQQGIQKQLYAWIEKHPITRQFVNFTDQTRNRMLALSSSRTNEYVTLDMKDASDRVSLRLVERLFEGLPLLDALKASRSSFTQLPDGRKVRLASFAPMGSAVCFPIEAMCFYALAVAAISMHTSTTRYLRLPNKQFRAPEVYVYGDDIIVRREDYASLLQYFPEVGLKFNLGKCCVARFFRESCGCDAFDGIDVTPIRLRTTWHHRGIREPRELVSYVALSNALHKSGYCGTAALIKRMVERRYGTLPFTRELTEYFDLAGRLKLDASALIGWFRPEVDHTRKNRDLGLPRRYNRDLHRLEYRTWTVKSKKKNFVVDGWREMLRVLTADVRKDILLNKSEPEAIDPTLRFYALPRRICMHRGWAPG